MWEFYLILVELELGRKLRYILRLKEIFIKVTYKSLYILLGEGFFDSNI